ncbi:hypothetical protein OJ996_26130 [Luteolibacter sp. GHJ8]|uniref:Uncharacterized protein n=1 Tax=Luteolibacter rhizosphaerae TaxID=2989719 RepID=A0ABT3GBU4_9BACT|nr:hypothetical protein [Luteolibacter rhizosphaerae]MCW1917094.1 hypothetical protein [Luteolibacter rhizosphaerae]
MTTNRPYHFSLSSIDFGQTIDGLSARRDAWTKTAQWFRGELQEQFFLIEECNDEYEAQQIADHYTEIIDTLQTQASPQRERKPSAMLSHPKPGETAHGWCLYSEVLGEGPKPAERIDDGFAVYATERAALEEYAEDMITRYQEFLRGEREAEEIDSGLFVVAVTLHPDGSLSDENNQHIP